MAVIKWALLKLLSTKPSFKCLTGDTVVIMEAFGYLAALFLYYSQLLLDETKYQRDFVMFET